MSYNVKPVTVVDNGAAFGHDHWYTFYCPQCGCQVTRPNRETHHICSTTAVFPLKGCDCVVEWPR